jgi:hypothetical protein
MRTTGAQPAPIGSTRFGLLQLGQAEQLPVEPSRVRLASDRRGDLHVVLADDPRALLLGQCRKCRCLVKTIATPPPSQASITSASRFEPPGWITEVEPASIAA